MRQLALVLVVACAACGSPHHATPDAAPVQLDLNVVVSHASVMLYTNASDRPQPCPGTSVNFPSPGDGTEISDGGHCATPDPSCLSDVSLVVDGGTIPAAIPIEDSIWIRIDVTAATNAVLAIDGCGGSATVPIGGLAPLPLTATGTRDTAAGTIAVQWDGDPAITSALVVFSEGEWLALRHVTERAYTFSLPYGEANGVSSVYLSGFGPPAITSTVYGDVHVWTGDVTPVTLQ